MISQSLSTSSSSAASYLRWLFGTIVFFVSMACSISWMGEKFNLLDQRFHVNYHFQLSKLALPAPVDTLFVGDSSLGALLDVEAWSALRGKPGRHLALTGSYGYAGSLNMVRRQLQSARPRNVVIFHTVDMMTRPLAFLGYLQTVPDGAAIRDVPLVSRIVEQLKFYFSKSVITGTLRGAWQRISGRRVNYLGKDYVRIPDVAGAPGKIRPGRHMEISSNEIKPKKTLFLNHLAALCRAEKLNCLYVHGPIFEKICQTSQPYLRDVSTLIKSTGLPLVSGAPACVPQGELADAIDHVRQDLKTPFTRRYYDLLKPHLQD